MMGSQLRIAGPLVALTLAVACGSEAPPMDHGKSSGAASAAVEGAPRRLPRGVAKLRTPGAHPAPAPAAKVSSPLQKLIYFGGRIISNVQCVEVNWGSGVNSTWTAGFPGFYQTIPASPWMDLMSQYETTSVRGQDGSLGTSQRVGHGGFVSAVTITPNEPATTISDIDIEQELQQQLLAGNLPMPTLDAFGFVNTIYMIDFPPSITINLYNAGGTATSCVQYGAYHSTMLFQGKSVPYGVHPDCGFDFPTATSIHSHELAEAVTDTEVGLVDPDLAVGITRPGAWYSFINGNDNGEIGDLCEGAGGGDVMVSGYNVQTIWSNSQGACVGTSPTLICDGASPPIPGCRACTAADNGVACNGARSVCETNAASVKFGQCVVCTQASQCAAPLNACVSANDSTDDTCVDTAACTGNTGCSGTTPICDTGTHACRACQDSDCSGATPVCEKRSSNDHYGQCVLCSETNATACAATTGFCDVFNNTCVGCVFNEDCPPSAQVCNHTTHTCGPCASSADCEVPLTCDANGRCVGEMDGGADSGPPDAGVDSGPDAGVDAGVDAGGDSGSMMDATMGDSGGMDSSSGDDSGNPGDAAADSGSPSPDAASRPDSGSGADSGSPDGEADGGGATPGDSGGCGCVTAGRSTSSTGGFAGLLLGLLVVLRRGRRA